MQALIDRVCTKLEPIGYLLLRLVAGGFLVAHGWPKWQAGAQAFATAGLARRGIEPALPLAYLVMSLELVGGLLIAVGLLTRGVAAVATLHLAFIAFWVSWSNGFGWTRSGWEYPAMWAAVLLLITLRGGGPFSVDRLLARRR